MADFPGSIYAPSNPNPTSPRTSPSLSGEVSGLNDEVVAIESTLGTNLSLVFGGIQWFVYAGDPNGHVTTSVVGSICIDTATPAIYQAAAIGNSSWVIASGGGTQLPVYSDATGAISLTETADGGTLSLETSGLGEGGIALLVDSSDTGGVSIVDSGDGGIGLVEQGTGGTPGSTGNINLLVESTATGGIQLTDAGGGGITIEESHTGKVLIEQTDASNTQGIEITDAGSGGITLSETHTGKITIEQTDASNSQGILIKDEGTGGITIEETHSGAEIIIENSGGGGIYITMSAGGGIIVTDSTSGILLHETGNGGIELTNDGTGGITLANTVSTTGAIVIIDEGSTANSDLITLPNLPTSDPGIAGQIYVGAANALFVSAG